MVREGEREGGRMMARRRTSLGKGREGRREEGGRPTDLPGFLLLLYD